MRKKIITILLMTTFIPAMLIAQSPDDPEIQKAKRETAVVFDLGRLFGYLAKMEENQKELALSNEQLEKIYTVMEEIYTTERLEPKQAEKLLTYLEDNVLSPEQLMYTDQLAIEKEKERETRTPGSGGGGGQITSYIAGGPFNPMRDPNKNIGKDFLEFYKYVAKRIGKE